MSKKKTKVYAPSVLLTVEQIKKLNKIRKDYPTASQFTITETYDSGIGASTTAEFTFVDNGVVRGLLINITDVSNW